MVLDFYKLREQPFGVTPDPRYLYLSLTHREALASLRYGIAAGRGFMALIAEPGMGKTTLMFQLLEMLENSAKTVFLFQTLCTSTEFLRSLLADLGVEDHGGDFVQMHGKLNELVARLSVLRKPLVVVVDEAQNLDDSTLEVLRMLSNFETPREKLIQIVLAGQPQFAEKLNSRSLVQLRQRVSILCRLKPFTADETSEFIDHRLRVAGYGFDTPLFSHRARALIADCSGGIPRNINNICFNALSLGRVEERKTIERDVIQEVIKDLDLESMLGGQPEVPGPQKNPGRPTNVGSIDRPRIGPSVRGWLRQPWNSTQLRLPDLHPLEPQHRSGDGQDNVAGRILRSPLGASLPRFAIAGALLVALLSWSLIPADKQTDRPGTPDVPAIVAASSVTRRSTTGRPDTAKVGPVAATGAPEAAAAKVDHALRPKPPVTRAMQVEDAPGDSRAVLVNQNQTLYQISVSNLGGFNSEILEKIRELNPWLKNPNYIQTGQQIRIPSQRQTLENTNGVGERPANAPATKAEKP